MKTFIQDLKVINEIKPKSPKAYVVLVAKATWLLFERYISHIVMFAGLLIILHQSTTKSHYIFTMYDLERVEFALSAMESSQRGYLVTQDPDLFSDYTRFQSMYKVSLYSLEDNLKGDRQNLRVLEDVKNTAQRKIGEMNMTLEYAQAGDLDKSRKLMATNIGHQFMKEIRENLTLIRSSKELQALSAGVAY